jgi:hypothetical protein
MKVFCTPHNTPDLLRTIYNIWGKLAITSDVGRIGVNERSTYDDMASTRNLSPRTPPPTTTSWIWEAPIRS